MAILTNEPVQIIRGLKADIAQRTGSDGEFNWATDSKELYIHDGKTRGGHLIGKVSGTAGVVGGAGIAVSTSDGISTVSIKRDPSSVLYATTDGAGVRLGNSGGLQVTAQNALDLHLAEGGGLVVDSNGLKVDSSVLTSVFRYAGQVNSVDDLPDDASIGDVYDVKDSGANYVWTGSSWDNLGGILSVDPSPTQGSTNPVASGGVYDAIQDTKLNGDGTTVTVADNTITAKDIAIDGDASDLASARGQIGNCQNLTNPDFHTITDTGFWFVTGNAQQNAPAGNVTGFLLSLGNKNSTFCMHLFARTLDNNTFFIETMHGEGAWQPWQRIYLQNNFGEGITFNNGKASVPEYEGATADAAGTSGLVPPAAAGEQDKYLGGDGEWHEIAVPSEVTLSDSVTSTSSTTAASSKAVKTAYDKAVSAATSASTAQSTANSAKTAATNAQNTANSANTKATNAQNTANSALSTAQAAQNTANGAGAKAECATWGDGTKEGLSGQNLPNYGTWRVFDGGTSTNLRGRTLAGGSQVAGSSKNYGIAVRIA